MYKQMNNKGSALVLVVFAMLISFFLGIALLEVSTVEFAMANNHVDGVKADYIAEAGMNKAIASFMYNTELLQELPVLLENIGDTFTLEIGESFAGGSFSDAEIKLIDKAKEYIIIELTTFGTYHHAQRGITCQGKLNFSYNQADQFMASNTAVICKEEFTTESGLIYVDGHVFCEGGISLGWNSTVLGDVFGYGNVHLENGTVQGDLYGTKDVFLGWNAHVTGDVTGRGMITVDGGNQIGGTVFGSENILLKWDADVAGNVKSLSTVTLEGKNQIGGDVFSSQHIDIDGQCDIVGDLISLGSIMMNGANTIRRDCFALGDMDFAWNEKIDGRVICYETFTDGGGSQYKSGIWGRNVVMEEWGTVVSGSTKPIKYVDQFYTDNDTYRNLAEKIDFSDMPDFPDNLDNIEITEPEIKLFPGIPDVKLTDYQGQMVTKYITTSDLISGGLDLSLLTPGVHYIDDNISSVSVYGEYSGIISLVSKGKIKISHHVTRAGGENDHDALMILSFNPSSDAISVDYNKTAEAFLFAPEGGITTESSVLLKGGVMGKRVSIGWQGEIYHIESILNKFGLGNTAVQSFEVINWRQVSGVL
ncbi:MAG TPA: polymer-forming cytoskeletal protein [Clostridia bacterium]|jgi:predicted acyltransferase (DUF342 family)|nr:polymer-forming cytoskeletal protein [Clostridia bacterium]